MSAARPAGRAVIAAMLVSTFMAAIEVTVISTAMPVIIARLGGFELFSWAFGIYVLAQAVTTPIYGRLADGLGRKPVYLGSVALFLAGSLLCGCAWSMGSLIAFRAVQGLGGGGLVPLATTIIGDVSEPAERPRLMSYVSGIWGVSAILGPALGAFLVNSLGWPFVFWLNLPIGVIAATMTIAFLREPERGAASALDPTAAALLAGGIGAVMVVLVQGSTLGVAGIALLAGAGVTALVGFAWRERRAPVPLLGTALLRRRAILAADLSAMLCGAAMIGMTAFLPSWVQGVTGGSAIESGYVLGVLTVSWTAASLGLGRLQGRVSGLTDRGLAVAGSASLLAGSLGLLALRPGTGLGWLDACCVLIGAGLGVNSLVFTVMVQSAVPRPDRGRATALFYFSRLVGQALGAASFGGVLNAGLAGAGPVAGELAGDGRAALPAADLARLTGLLANGLHGVFVLAALVAAGTLAAAFLAPSGAATAAATNP